VPQSPRRRLVPCLLLALLAAPGLAGGLALVAQSKPPANRPLAARQAPPVKAPPAPAGFQLSGDPARGEAIYARSCDTCHGPAGKGDGKIAAGLKPRPQDLTDAKRMSAISDWEIYLVVRDGGPAVGLAANMLSWGKTLSDQEIRDVSAYVRSLSRPAG
jgi:mono/diheme cytochrome c family protein